MSALADEETDERDRVSYLIIENEFLKIQNRHLKAALVGLLAQNLDVEPEHLDPKDVMRFHSPSYEVLCVEPKLAPTPKSERKFGEVPSGEEPTDIENWLGDCDG